MRSATPTRRKSPAPESSSPADELAKPQLGRGRSRTCKHVRLRVRAGGAAPPVLEYQALRISSFRVASLALFCERSWPARFSLRAASENRDGLMRAGGHPRPPVVEHHRHLRALGLRSAYCFRTFRLRTSFGNAFIATLSKKHVTKYFAQLFLGIRAALGAYGEERFWSAHPARNGAVVNRSHPL